MIGARLVVLASAVVLVDQLVKRRVLSRSAGARGAPLSVHVDPLRHERLGRLPIRNRAIGVVVWFVALATVLIVLAPRMTPDAGVTQGALAVFVAGGVANLIDWVVRGAVIDHIRVPLLPRFNLADVAIVVGVVAILATL